GRLRRADGSPLPVTPVDRAELDPDAYDLRYVRGFRAARGHTASGLEVSLTPHAGLGVGSEGRSAEAGVTLKIGEGLDRLAPNGRERFGDYSIVPHATGFGLYDRQVVANSGEFLSRIMNAEQNVPWNAFDFRTTLPFGKELPDNGISESTSNYPSLSPNLMSGIQSLLHLNEIASSTTPDKSGQANTITLYGTPPVTVEPGKLHKSIRLHNQSSIDLGNASSLHFGTGSFTASAWVRTNLANVRQRIVSSGFTGTSSFNAGFNLGMLDGAVTFGLCKTSGTVATCSQIKTLSSIADGHWHHVSGVFDSTTQLMKVFVDGKISSIQADTDRGLCGNITTTQLDITGCGLTATGSPGNTFLGAYKAGGTYMEGLEGLIDEAALWSRSLSPVEIQSLYRRGSERVLLQVRSCANASCSSTSGWKGPDQSPGSFYSEIHNNTQA
ncbi:MAG: LamG domain-containing protein, partial [Verrucomicrobiaceae bacterium]